MKAERRAEAVAVLADVSKALVKCAESLPDDTVKEAAEVAPRASLHVDLEKLREVANGR
jgi:ABC-type nitrate/sulfonate/bicarbonate transport system substrate-binding protein